MNIFEYWSDQNLYLYILKYYIFFVFVLATCYSLGKLLLPRDIHCSFIEIVALRLCLGLGAFSLVIMVLGQFGILYYSIFLVVVSGLLLNRGIICYRQGVYIGTKSLFLVRQLNKKEILVIFIIATLSIIKYRENIFAFLVQPLFPPLSLDALIYHLANAKWYAEQHSLQPPYHMIVPIRAQTIQMFYTFGLVMGDENFAQIFSYIFVLCVCLALIALGQRYFSIQSGILAAVLFSSSSIPFQTAASPITDWGVTVFSCAGILAFFNWFNTTHRNWVILTGVFIGFAFTSKYQAIILLCILFILIIFYSYRRAKLTHAVLFVLGFILSSGLWLARTYYYCGQIISMLGNCKSIDLIQTAQNVPLKIYATFQNKAVIENSSAPSESGFSEEVNTTSTKNLITLSRVYLNKIYTLFYDLVGGYFLPQEPNFYTAFSSYYLYFLPLALLSAKHNTNVRIGLGIAFVFLFAMRAIDREPRFVMPPIAILSLPIAYGIEFGLKIVFKTYKQATTRWSLMVIIALVLVNNNGNFSSLSREKLPITPQEKRNFLSRYLPSYDAYAFMNDDKPNGYVVYQLYGHAMTYYINGIGLPADGREYDLDLVKRLLSDSDFLYNTLDSLNVDYLLVGENVWVSSSLPSPYQNFLDFEQDPIFNKRFKLKNKGKSYGKELWVYELQK